MVETLALPHLAAVWIDVNEPTETELRDLAVQRGLPITVVHDCLDSLHPPKFERLEGADFFIVRHYDPEATGNPSCDTVRELTRKTAIFIGKDFLITVHRKQPPFLEALREKYAGRTDKVGRGLTPILVDLVRAAILSYEHPLEDSEQGVDSFELHIFNNLANASVLEAMYIVKRRVGVYRRMLRQTLDILYRLPPEVYPPATWGGTRERGERLSLLAEDTVEEIRHLLNTHISLASHRTNEVMRVLTVFSAFFLPLTFVVGVYGMNFQFMPELKWPLGYGFVWGLMALITAGIFFWFRRRGWLR